jgi:AraC family transcriptional activator of tynA and feaB
MADGLRLSTNDLPTHQRRDWLREVIGREYANVEITPPADGRLFNEMTIYPWKELRLSSIRSNAITMERLPHEPHQNSHDAYFAVILLSGEYRLEQNGREVFLSPGDMTIYDATRPHRIVCPESFAKLIVSIPRPMLRERAASIEDCVALRIPGNEGMGSVTANFIRSSASHADELPSREFSSLSDHCMDLLTLALGSVRQASVNASRHRIIVMNRIKDFVEHNLRDPDMTTAMVAHGVNMSPRYINDIFKNEETSLIRYIWKRRLENCRRDLLSQTRAGDRISDIAFRWGFNDVSHFSRTFKQSFSLSPRDYRQQNAGEAGLPDQSVPPQAK